MANIEAVAHLLRIKVANHGPDIPNRRANITVAGMVLEPGTEAQFLVQGRNPLETRTELSDLLRNRFVLGIAIKAEPISLNSQLRHQAQQFLRPGIDLGN